MQRPDGTLEIVDVADVGEDALLVHDETLDHPSLAFALSRLAHTPTGPRPIGVFRDVERPVYDELMAGQLERAVEERGAGDLEALLHAGDTWVVSDGDLGFGGTLPVSVSPQPRYQGKIAATRSIAEITDVPSAEIAAMQPIVITASTIEYSAIVWPCSSAERRRSAVSM